MTLKKKLSQIQYLKYVPQQLAMIYDSRRTSRTFTIQLFGTSSTALPAMTSPVEPLNPLKPDPLSSSASQRTSSRAPTTFISCRWNHTMNRIWRVRSRVRFNWKLIRTRNRMTVYPAERLPESSSEFFWPFSLLSSSLIWLLKNGSKWSFAWTKFKIVKSSNIKTCLWIIFTYHSESRLM